ncbi:zinc finger protein 208-like [Anopheles maculipalpis]|uniref:zinc finger protein 208-like n=1 Tax=Anopheles maculipalpis TaxID=1496333 RepID=UPI002159827B|nr:zinc finger protein 208-like [Anopheles maculipalpis]
MTNSTCAAGSCTYNRRNVRKLKLDIVFHTFPRDPVLRKKWIRFCRRESEWVPKSNEAICSTHFRKEDYQMANSPLMLTPGPSSFRRLHLTAIPTIWKGKAIPIEKQKKMDEKARQQLLEELYSKDAMVRDNDHSYEDVYNIGSLKNKLPKLLDKPVYNLQKFPNICTLCFKPIDDESLFSPFNSYHNELECTVQQMFEEITDEPFNQTEMANIHHLVPDKVCTECSEAIITFYQYRKQLKCLGKFTTGMAHLVKGNRKPLKALYQEQGPYLAKLLQSLNVCQGPVDTITFERLEREVATYGRIVKCTLYVPPVRFPHLNSAVSRHSASIPSGDTSTTDDQCEELIDDETLANIESLPSVAIDPSDSYKPEELIKPRGRPRKRMLEGGTSTKLMCPYLDVCREWFADEATLQKHVSNDHKIFKCRACGAKIKFYDIYKKHIESHAIARALLLCHNQKGSNKASKCASCGKAFHSEELLRRHETTHTGERNFVCGTCLGVYLTNHEFSNHTCTTHKAKEISTEELANGQAIAGDEVLVETLDE